MWIRLFFLLSGTSEEAAHFNISFKLEKHHRVFVHRRQFDVFHVPCHILNISGTVRGEVSYADRINLNGDGANAMSKEKQHATIT